MRTIQLATAAAGVVMMLACMPAPAAEAATSETIRQKVLQRDPGPPVFAVSPRATVVSGWEAVSLPPAIEAQNQALVDLPTTHPAWRPGMYELLAQVPAQSVLASNLRLRLLNDELRSINAYTQPDRDLTTQTSALMEIANADVPVLRKDMVKARKLVARILHYHSNNREQAWSAYHQILADATRDGDLATQVIIRMQIAACAIELYEQTGLEWEELLPLLRELRAQNEAAETARWDQRDAVSRQTRWTTARIGLMITEVLMKYNQWTTATAENEAFLAKYAELPECQEETAEAYCHRARIMLTDKKATECLAAADKAIAVARKVGRPIWGDPDRDVLWKAYGWKNSVAYHFDVGRDFTSALHAEMRELFRDHPSLHRYVPPAPPDNSSLWEERAQ
jgi:ribosomal protein L17